MRAMRCQLCDTVVVTALHIDANAKILSNVFLKSMETN